MAKHSFGTPLEEDILEIQGKEYRLQPFGMRAFKASLDRSKQVAELVDEDDQTARVEAMYSVSVDTILNAVHPDDRERLAEHLEDSVPPVMVANIASTIMRGLSDLDPTQPTSSSDGSSETGPDSMDGASEEG